jgi:hypothetical protein
MYNNFGGSFLENKVIVTIQKLGKNPTGKEISKTYVLHGGKRVPKQESALFSCHSSLSRWQECKPIYVKVHYPLSWNYQLKRLPLKTPDEYPKR